MELNCEGVPAAAPVQCRREERTMTASGSTSGSGSMSDDSCGQWREREGVQVTTGQFACGAAQRSV